MKKDLLLIHVGLCFLMALAGCASTGPQSAEGSAYSEDLSEWRMDATDSSVNSTNTKEPKNPNVIDKSEYVPARFTVNDKVFPVLDSIDRLNLKQKYVDGYSIQLYLGIDREEAFDTKKQFALDFPMKTADLKYTQPNYRVRSGAYYSRIEAQEDFLEIRRRFPSAIIIPDKIPIPQ